MNNHNQRSIGILIGGICTLSLAMGISRFGFTPIIPLMQRDLGIAEWAIAILASANYAGYLIGAYISREQWFREHSQAWLKGGLIATILTLAVMPFTANFFFWTLLRLLAGFLSAILFVIASAIILRQGGSAWAGWLYSGVGIGIAFTGLVVPAFDIIGGWKASWQGLALGGSIFGIIAWHTLSKISYRKIEGQTPNTKKLKRDWAWYVLLISYGLEGTGYIITATFIVQMIKAIPELSPIANQSWILIGLAAAPAPYLWGQFARKTSIRTSLLLAFSLQAVGILLPVISPNQISTLIGGVLFGGTFMGITSLTLALASRMKEETQMQAIGELTTVYALGQIIGPIVAAYLQQSFNILAPSFFAVFLLLCAVFVLMTLKAKAAGSQSFRE